MSKSRGNAIRLAATPDETAALIRKALTDSESLITYEPERPPEVANLLNIASGFTGAPPEQIAAGIGAGGGSALKKAATEAVNEGLRRHRELRRTYAADPAQLSTILRAGNDAANAVADETLSQVRSVMSTDY